MKVARPGGAAALLLAAGEAGATVHLMQIEQVIGGVNGDPAAQAVQLRMRAAGQTQLQFARLRLWDNQGLPLLLLIDFDRPVANGQAGARILLATAAFLQLLDPPIDADFIIEEPMPPAYLQAASLTFEHDSASVYWRLSWGGEAYQGPTDGLPFNDADGEFGPPCPESLSEDGTSALIFDGPAEALSTSNAADYLLNPGKHLWTNNAGETGVLPLPSCTGDVNGDLTVDVSDLSALILSWGATSGPADVNDDGQVDVLDLALLVLSWGPCPVP